MHAVLHRLVDEPCVGGRLAERGGEHREALHVEHLGVPGGSARRRMTEKKKRKQRTTHEVRPRIMRREHGACARGAQLEAGHDRERADRRGPVEPHEVADAAGRRRRVEAPLGAGVGRVLGEDLAQGDARCGCVGGCELGEVRPDEAADEGGGDVVRVALDHEGEVEEAGGGQVECGERVAEEDAGDDGGAGRAEAAAEGDGVADADGEVGGEARDGVAAEEVERDARGEVLVGVERDLVGALAVVVQHGVRVLCRRGREWVGDVEVEEEREREADDVEAGSDVRRRRGHADRELAQRHGGGGQAKVMTNSIPKKVHTYPVHTLYII